jgi:hypothetical protein
MLEWHLNGYYDPQPWFGACYLQGEVNTFGCGASGRLPLDTSFARHPVKLPATPTCLRTEYDATWEQNKVTCTVSNTTNSKWKQLRKHTLRFPTRSWIPRQPQATIPVQPHSVSIALTKSNLPEIVRRQTPTGLLTSASCDCSIPGL